LTRHCCRRSPEKGDSDARQTCCALCTSSLSKVVRAARRAGRGGTGGTERDAVDPFGVVDIAVGANGVVVAGAVRGREGSDETSVTAGDGGSLGVLEAPADTGVVAVLTENFLLSGLVGDDHDVRGTSDSSTSEGDSREKSDDSLLHFDVLM